MITHERLKELIEQEATIWTVNRSGNIKPTIANKTCEIQRQYLMKEGQIYSYIEQTFETKEEAEWTKEFGCIERTEKLVLPTWEDACDGAAHNISFTTPKVQKVEMIICDGHIDIVSIYQSIIDFSKPLTKENYTLACRKAKELFLGQGEE